MGEEKEGERGRKREKEGKRGTKRDKEVERGSGRQREKNGCDINGLGKPVRHRPINGSDPSASIRSGYLRTIKLRNF